MRIKHLFFSLFILLKERKWQRKLKYIFVNNHSDELAVIFSGFSSGAPRYNYIRTLRDKRVDQLFILDVFGNRGSYYVYENGNNTPELLTGTLINHFVDGGGYKRIIMAGSSKGGSCAIYYGLKKNATDIYAGAPQYYLGNYVKQFPDIMRGMLGENVSIDGIELLNSLLVNVVKDATSFKGVIHLLFSKNEHTYAEHIKDMIKDINLVGINLELIEMDFTDHNQVGAPFSSLLKERL